MPYSPLGVTYGFRSSLLLESFDDYHKYHKKVNHKLQQLRGRLNLISKDTKNYKGKEKLDKVTVEDYHKNRLNGFLILLLAERDLAYVESIKATGRQRGFFKKGELKLMRTRIRKAMEYVRRLATLAQGEDKWHILAEIMIYQKLIETEYQLYGRNQVKYSDAEKTSTSISLALLGVDFLVEQNLLMKDTAEAVKSKYLYIFKEKANAFSTRDQQLHFDKTLKNNSDDVLVKLLQSHGFSFSISDVIHSKTQSREISWRSYTAIIEDSKVFEVYSDLNENQGSNKLSVLNDKIMKWNRAIELQKEYITTYGSEDDNNENNQILLTYLQYNSMITAVERDNNLFDKLVREWDRLGNKSFTSKINKYKEVDHVVKNLKSLLNQLMDLPGVYSDNDLTDQIFLLKTYYETAFASKLLAHVYHGKKQYVEALALYVESLKQLENAEGSLASWDEVHLPTDLLSKNKIAALKNYITSSWRSVAALAEYKKSLEKDKKNVRRYEQSLIEKLDIKKISPGDVQLDNLFNIRPRLLPLPPKPFVYDLAYNYFEFPNDSSEKYEIDKVSAPGTKSNQTPEDKAGKPKKGLFGLFGG